MFIRKGTEADLNELEQLYDTLNDYLETHENYPGWKKGVYPIREDAQKGVSEQALFVVMNADHIAGSFILRHEPEPAYQTVAWGIDLPYEYILVVYTLVVHPDDCRQGIGTHIMNYIKKYAKENKIKAIRLDTYEKNLPAIHLYEKEGFCCCGKADLGYGKYGLDWFLMYQFLL